MNNVVNILIRSLSVEFYRLNAGFFLLIGTLTFGFMSMVEHVALAEVFGSSPYTMLIAVSVWLIYAVKIVSFNYRQLRLPENLIFAALDFIPFGQRARCAFIVFALQFIPAIAYGIFVAIAGSPSPQSLIIIIAALVACCTVGAAVLLRGYGLPRVERNLSALSKFLDRHLHKSVMRCYVEHVIRRDPLMVAATKIFSLSLVIGVCNLYRYESYDGRLMMMALTLCGLSHLLIVYRLQEFEHVSVAWWRNLPIRIETRYFRIAAALSVFLLPEGVALFNYCPLPHHASLTISGVLYLISINCFLAGLVQCGTLQVASLTKKVFVIMTALLLFILFGIPGIIRDGACVIAGFVLFMRCYYTFEPPPGANQ